MVLFSSEGRECATNTKFRSDAILLLTLACAARGYTRARAVAATMPPAPKSERPRSGETLCHCCACLEGQRLLRPRRCRQGPGLCCRHQEGSSGGGKRGTEEAAPGRGEKSSGEGVLLLCTLCLILLYDRKLAGEAHKQKYVYMYAGQLVSG